MFKYLLDLSPEPTLAEKAKSHTWLIVIALVALAGIVGYFIWKRKKSKQNVK